MTFFMQISRLCDTAGSKCLSVSKITQKLLMDFDEICREA